MRIHMGARREGDVVKLTADKTWREEALLKVLRSEGIEIIVGPMTPGRTRLGVRAPRGMSMKITNLTRCQSTESYVAPPGQ